MRTVRIGEREFDLTRARLGGYLALQSAESRLREAASRTEVDAVCETLFSILASTIPVPRELFDSAPWQDIAGAISAVRAVNRLPDPDRFSILRFQKGESSVPWDYPERGRILWIHQLASAYGWTADEIFNLWPEDALGLLQEVLADRQLDREFQHNLSDLSYDWDTHGHGKLRPLERPAWMQLPLHGKEIKTRMLKRLLPIGVVVTDAGNTEQAPSGN
jgi:hypothetical protein